MHSGNCFLWCSNWWCFFTCNQYSALYDSISKCTVCDNIERCLYLYESGNRMWENKWCGNFDHRICDKLILWCVLITFMLLFTFLKCRRALFFLRASNYKLFLMVSRNCILQEHLIQLVGMLILMIHWNLFFVNLAISILTSSGSWPKK